MKNRLAWFDDFKKKNAVIACAGVALLFLCLFMAMNFMLIFMKILGGEDILRHIIVFLVTAFGWVIIVVLVNQIWWKTFLQMLFYTLAIVAIFLFCFCMSGIFQYFWYKDESFNFTLIMVCFLVSVPMCFGSCKALKLRIFDSK